MAKTKEIHFEDAIECVLLHGGTDACADAPTPAVREPLAVYGEGEPGGYLGRTAAEYDRALCLIPRDTVDFIIATQPAEWTKLKAQYGPDVEPQFLKRLAGELTKRGTLDVLRRGVKDSGCKFQLAYFRPSSGLNVDLGQLHLANLFSVVRQLHYSEKNENSLDLVLFLNGLPIFTAELKNPLTGQNVEHAIRQYRKNRDPREPLFRFGRCLAHFAVDPDLVYVTTELAGPRTRFLPFNRGRDRGAGNPPVPPTRSGYPTSYLWERIWARNSVLDLVRQFIHLIEDKDEKGKKTRQIIFPRYHQLDCVRRLVSDARDRGAGHRYLIQHSAGSGKSNSIAWLAHQLSTLHDANDKKVFDSIVVITDRRVLDRQLQKTVQQFEQILGVVENINTTSRQLKEALEAGKTIIVTTLQKFPVIADEISSLPGKRFAVIVDEAHSSQSGESTKSMKDVLATSELAEAEAAEVGAESPEEELESRILTEIAKRGHLPNVSTFAFTATPKPKTLELFGRERPDGKFEPFSLYSMRQAIEERFILDVLENYTTYTAYWKLLKKIEDDPKYDKGKATYLLKSFVDLHPHAIDQKIRIMVDHFETQVQHAIGGRAKAMIVTRSRLHAVRYKLALDRYLKEKGLPFRALVAFSGTVEDGGKNYTEPGMNGFSDRQTAGVFNQPEYRFLVVAAKFQTGFDQPFLHTMYVDKKLGGVNAVQTLSRLNRTHPGKTGTVVLDFANEAEAIREAFEPYYETTLLSESTDPNLLYDIQSRLLGLGVYTEPEVDAFAKLYFDPKSTSDQFYAALAPQKTRFQALDEDEQSEFRGLLTDYVRLYAFLSQVMTFKDVELEGLYAFARHLRRLIPAPRESLPLEVQQNIDMDSYKIEKTWSGPATPGGPGGVLDPQGAKDHYGVSEEYVEPLSAIIAELNERFGLNLGPEHKVTLDHMIQTLDLDPALDAAARANTRDKLKLSFDHKVEAVIQKIVESNFDLYKKINDNEAFGSLVKNFLFDQYVKTRRQAVELLKQHESKTLEFKSTLRWNLKEDRKDPKVVTHSVLKTIAAFLNTDGGDLLIGVADDKNLIGIEADRFKTDDDFLLHLSHVVSQGLGDSAGTCIDPRIQLVDGTKICVVGCQRSPEPVFLKWKKLEATEEGNFFVRVGAQTKKLSPEEAAKYVTSRFGGGNEQLEGVS